MRMRLMLIILLVSELVAVQPYFVKVSDGNKVAVVFPGRIGVYKNFINAGGARIHWIGEKENPLVVFRHEMPAKIHVFRGSSKGKHMCTYSQIIFKNVYKGIHRILTVKEKGINISWVVEPGADPSSIRFKVENLWNSRDTISLKPFPISNIKAFQGVKEISVKPVMENGIISFRLSKYDRSSVLVIDPDLTTMEFSSYIGGPGSDGIFDIVVANNHVYVVGTTDTSLFPVTPGSYDNTYNGELDIFIAKMSLNLDTLVAATYLGGDSYDYGYAIDVNSSGQIIVTGVTYSANFPVHNGVFPLYADSGDAYVAILSGDLDSLIASTYFGGSFIDQANDITVKNDSIFICGTTYSPDLPAAGNPLSGAYSGYGDGFIAVFLPDLSDLIVSTYLGGSDEDALNGISIDSVTNSVYVAGYSMSTDMPVTSGAYDVTNSGHDGYVGNLSTDLSYLLAGTFIGNLYGSEMPPTEAKTVAYLSYPEFPDFNAVAVGGFTSARFPLVNPFDSLMNGFQEGFVSIFTPGLDSLLGSSLVGGLGMESVNDIKRGLSLNPSLVLVGETDSSMMPGATGAVPFDSSFNGARDAFVYVIVWSRDSLTPIGFTYYGGSDFDGGSGVFVKDSLIFVVGGSESSDLPILGGFDASFGGIQDGYVTAFNHEVSPATDLSERRRVSRYISILKNDRVEFTVEETGYVGIEVFDATGRRVFRRSFGITPPGTYVVRIKGMKSGVGFLKLRIGDEVRVIKILKY